MPSSVYGFTGQEILQHVRDYVGNQSTTFTSYLTTVLPLAEMRFCQAYDWNFLKKNSLSLTVTSGTMFYTLDTASIGYNVAAEDVVSVTSPSKNRMLRKVTLDYIRTLDPDNNDGTTSSNIMLWAPSGDNQVAVYPKTFAETTLTVDAIITPNALLTLSNYPTIPFKYQESFIEYIKAVALDREDDDRAASQRQYAQALILKNIQNEQDGKGDKELPRIKASWEMEVFGNGDLNQLYNLWAFYS